ncbi:ArnT family glycosyltransferase [Xanthobacter sp. TB0139]|uniref:ArnT family glycosyltransferase n=1 Tax=Xanthobacter sp. TB0139 TaxID=3459178 RepID=UPI0040398E58
MHQHDEDGPGARSLRVLGFLILGALMTSIIVALQRASGAYGAEFAATRASEAGHVVTGFMVADYLASGLPAPLAFIADYALHFPRVVIGIWPPLYYVLEGAWVSVLGPSTPAVLLLPAVLSALLMVSAGWATGRVLGPLPGAAASVALLAMPSIREATIIVGLDLPLALFALWAGLAWARFMASDGARGAVPFALLASAAILTKGTGVFLLALPLVSLLFSGRFELVRRRGFWLALLIILVLAGPWTIGTYPMVSAVFPSHFGTAFMALASYAYGHALLVALGVVLVAFAGIGIIFAVLDGWRRKPRAEIMVAMAALAVSAGAVLCILPLGIEDGAILPLIAPAMMLATYGLVRFAGLVISGWPTIVGLGTALALLLLALPGILEPLHKAGNAMDELAEAVLARSAGAPTSVLVVADPRGENALIAAMAQQDRTVQNFALPASSMLAVPGRGPASGAPLYPDPQDLLAGLEAMAPGYLAIDTAPESRQGTIHAEVSEVLSRFPDHFELLTTFPRGDGRGEARLYRLTHPAKSAHPALPSGSEDDVKWPDMPSLDELEGEPDSAASPAASGVGHHAEGEAETGTPAAAPVNGRPSGEKASPASAR